MKKRNAIIASTSTLYGGGYLEYILPELKGLYEDVDEVLFIPYARPGGISHDSYTRKAAAAFQSIGKKLRGVHGFKDPVEAIAKAKGVFTGGGNTFVLVNELYRTDLMASLRRAVLGGTPYLGTSAGSNICGPGMQTTNDMPITYPPSFDTLGVLRFNLNPHYLDPIADSTHMGETRETRIKEFHTQNDIPVVGLREGSWLRVQGEKVILCGEPKARVFTRGNPAWEASPGTDFSKLE